MLTREQAIERYGEAKVEEYEADIKKFTGWNTAQVYGKIGAAAEILELDPTELLWSVRFLAVLPREDS